MDKIFFTLMLFFATGCVTFNSESTLNPHEIHPTNDVKCIEVEFYRNEINSLNQVTPEKKISNYDSSEYSRILEQYNISTNCSPKVAKYKITIGMRNNYMLLKTVWMTTSFITLGILPFYMADKYDITLQKDLSSDIITSISTDKAISIFLLPIAIYNYNYSYKNFKTSDSNLTISKTIAKLIITDLNK